jgi:hypothetical protein
MNERAFQSTVNRYPARLRLGLVLAAGATGTAVADSSTPLLASHYDRHMAICGGDAYEWSGEDTPRKAMRDVTQVGVGKSGSYALSSGVQGSHPASHLPAHIDRIEVVARRWRLRDALSARAADALRRIPASAPRVWGRGAHHRLNRRAGIV